VLVANTSKRSFCGSELVAAGGSLVAAGAPNPKKSSADYVAGAG